MGLDVQGCPDHRPRPRILEDVVLRPDAAIIQTQLPDLEHWRPRTGCWG